jgi:hypothetical protein
MKTTYIKNLFQKYVEKNLCSELLSGKCRTFSFSPHYLRPLYEYISVDYADGSGAVKNTSYHWCENKGRRGGSIVARQTVVLQSQESGVSPAHS